LASPAPDEDLGTRERSAVEVRVLGPVEATDGTRSVDLGTRMHRSVFSLLITEAGRVVSSDRLVDSLWGDDPPPTAAKALQVYVSGLRKALEPDRPPGAPSHVLVTRPHGYALALPSDAVDAARFEKLVAEAQTVRGAGRASEAYELLERALQLWRGSAYEDLAFESFLQPEIARLHEVRATAAEARVDAMLALGRHAEAVAEGDVMVVEEPLREQRWRLLALALYRDGRQGEALRALDRARRTLGEQLGLAMGPALRRLEQDILSQSPSLELTLADEQPARARRVSMQRAPSVIRSLASAGLMRPVARPEGTKVLPPTACPHGVSLAAMATVVAPFTMSGNDPAKYPATPFQVLYVETIDVQPAGTGAVASGTNAFTATAGTYFYTPVFAASDGPPVVGTFPSAPADAPSYLFDPGQYGARDFEVIVDGTSTVLVPEYVVGPDAYTGEGGSRIVTLAAFVGPLDPGLHTVRARGGVFGRGLTETEGVSFIEVDFTYDVAVVVDTD
jgi:DNA-binding SARP family transcriptional activator